MKQITAFWNYFQKNEKEIINALLLGINTDQVYSLLNQKLCNVSKRIGYEIVFSSDNSGKHTIIFTAYGYRKLFPKLIALENQAPTLQYFISQAFIKPLKDISKYRNGEDAPVICENYEIKISELQIALLDYNITTKQIKINLSLPHYNDIKQYEDLKSSINWIVMLIVGEIAYRKHIKETQLNQLPMDDGGLLNLIDLPDFIDYLCKINSRKKSRMV